MANSPGDDNVVTVPVGVKFLTHAKHVCKVLRYTWLLSNNDDGHVVEAQRRPYLNPPLSPRWAPCTHEMEHFIH